MGEETEIIKKKSTGAYKEWREWITFFASIVVPPLLIGGGLYIENKFLKMRAEDDQRYVQQVPYERDKGDQAVVNKHLQDVTAATNGKIDDLKLTVIQTKDSVDYLGHVVDRLVDAKQKP